MEKGRNGEDSGMKKREDEWVCRQRFRTRSQYRCWWRKDEYVWIIVFFRFIADILFPITSAASAEPTTEGHCDSLHCCSLSLSPPPSSSLSSPFFLSLLPVPLSPLCPPFLLPVSPLSSFASHVLVTPRRLQTPLTSCPFLILRGSPLYWAAVSGSLLPFSVFVWIILFPF